MKTKAVSVIMLILILVGMFNVPLGVSEIDVDGVLNDSPILQTVDDDHPLDHPESHSGSWNSPDSQVFNGNASAGDDLGFFSPGEDAWNFSEIMEWSRFAYVNDNLAEVVIGVNNAKPHSYDGLMNLIRENHGKIVNTVSIEGETIAFVVNMSVMAASSFVDRVRSTGLSRYIEPNMRFQAQLIPNDPYWSDQWGPAKIEADYAWDTTIGDSSVLVAVIDTGIDYNHPDLATNYVALGYDWVNNDTDPMDDCFHGTHCAGIIAATINNNEGIAGLAQVRIMAEKGLDEGGSGWASDLAEAIIHAVDQGADILSNSWGGYWPSNLIYDAVRYACDAGVLVVASAGNEGGDVRGYPSAYKEVVAVTATDQEDSPASFTSFGNWVEVAAPGVDIYSTISEIHDDRFSYPYDYCSGTSMAGPHVAGVAALIWSRFPSLTLDQVRVQLQRTADDLGDLGFDIYYGYGRINARKAVEQVLPTHDLHVLSWERPPYMEPGSSVVINTTVLNFGASSEAGVTVRLLVNGSAVDTEFINSLPSGASVKVGCSWSPTVEARYDVESYVVPVSGETFVANNVESAYINVRVGRFIRVPEDCSSIQEAVDLANSGETIKVASGTYYEIVTIDRSLNLVGQDRNTTVIDANGTGSGVHVIADSVVVRGFTVQNSGRGLPLGGIVLGYVKNCVVANNMLINNFEGVLLWGCTGNNSVYNNLAFSIEDAGIGSVCSAGCDSMSDNVITGGQFGIAIIGDPYEPGEDNRENTVRGNTITKSEYGIGITADDNTVVNNTITSCSDRGIWLSFSGNTIRDNRLENNERGILLEVASSNRIYQNDFIHNTVQVYFIGSPYPNTWDDGYPSGGNHWSDYTGVDTNQDGIGDTPYVLGTDNVDRYPLMHPLLTPFYGPHARFTCSPTTQYVNKTVAFNASSSVGGWNGTARVSIINYTWNFGDGNVTTVTNPVIFHTYVAIGTYTVNLTVTCQDDPVLIAEGLASDSTLRDMRIILPPPPDGPTAKFDFWTHIPYVNDTVTFFASASVPGYNGTHNVPIANYTWNFGDGDTTTTTTPVIEHTYAYNITYTVNLTVICQDDSVLIAKGLTSDSTWQNITIRTESPALPPLTTALFEDNFEGYDVGTFPYSGGWELWECHGNLWNPSTWEGLLPYQVIVNNTPTKSLQLSGYVPNFPFPVAAKRINVVAPVIGFEAWVRVHGPGTVNTEDIARIGFVKKTGTYTVKWYAMVSFTDNDIIWAGSQLLQSYIPGRWYKVRVIVDRPTGTFSVWINDVLKGGNFTASGDLHEIQALGLTDCLWGPSSTRTFFDEVKIYYQPLHDLSITRVAPSSTVVEQGRKVPINITVANQGDLTETFKLTTYANTNIIANLTNITLTSGNSTTITFTWNTKGVAKGDYIISAKAGVVPGETDTGDNTLANGIVTILSRGHDVAIKCVTPSRYFIGQGNSLSINVTAKNYGSFVETFNVTVYANTTLIGTQTVNNLPEGMLTILTFTWNTTGFDKGNYTITANATQVPNETDLDDNTITDGWVLVTIFGDVNGDGSTNIIDILLCCTNMGPAPPNPPEYDVNGDGEVNVIDILLCCVNMG